MAKRKCYFQCIYEGQLYGFPPPSYTNFEKFCKWKNVLRKFDQEKDNLYIAHNIKLCASHFEKHFIAGNNRLTRHAVPSLNLGLNRKQEYLLCSFIEKNAKLIMHDNLQGETLNLLRAIWKMVTPKLNALGPMKSYSGWAEYLKDVMTNLKSKEVKWRKEDDILSVENCDDFTELELKILHLWNTKGTDPDLFEATFSDVNDTDMEFVLEVDVDDGIMDNNIDNNIDSNVEGDIDSHIESHMDNHIGSHMDSHIDSHIGSHMDRHIDSHIGSHMDSHIDSHIGSHMDRHIDSHVGSHMDRHIGTHIDSRIGSHVDSRIGSHIDRNTETKKEIITYSLYVETGGHTPLLQAADIAPCKGPNNSNIMCKCKHSDGEYQDDFEAFGKEVARELRNMPIEIASETQRQLMTILRSKQRKLINDSFL